MIDFPPLSGDATVYSRFNDWSALKARGEETSKFLNGFCTNDLTQLSDGDSCEAFFTDVKAHVLAYTTICRLSATEFLILLSSPQAEELAAHLDRYLIREAVTIEVLTEHQYIFTNAPTLPTTDTIRVPLKAYAEKASCWISKSSLISNPTELLAKEGFDLLTAEELDAFRILRGVPKDRVDVDHRNLPQEVDRIEQTISFTKGCYLGQEPIARIDALGHVNWLLRGLHTDSHDVLSVGADLMQEEKIVGRVTSFVVTEQGTFGLGYVRRQFATNGNKLMRNNQTVTVVELPFEA